MRDDGGCGFYRCMQPSAFLNRSGLAKSSTVLRNPTPEQLLASDLVVMQDMGSPEAMGIIQFLQKHKIPFVAEIDDFLHHVSPHNLGGYHTWNPATLYVHRAMQLVKQAAALIVSTEALAREYFPYNANIYVVPNYLDKDKWDIPITKRADGKIRIGWCGGNAHADDLKMISAVIDKMVKKYDGKVVFETMGMTEAELAGVFPMRSTSENSCPSCGFEGSLHHFPGETQENFPSVLASRGWDIAVAPVIDNAFGNCKSDLKLKEYAALKMPVVASAVKPYVQADRNGSSVLLAETFEDWEFHLKHLIDDVEFRQKMAKNNDIWVEKNWIQDRIPEIFAVFKEVSDRYTQQHGASILGGGILKA